MLACYLYMYTCSDVDTSTVKGPNNYSEKTPLLGADPNTKHSINVECRENASDEREAVLEESELHKAKDFQLIHVPKGAVSLLLKLVVIMLKHAATFPVRWWYVVYQVRQIITHYTLSSVSNLAIILNTSL